MEQVHTGQVITLLPAGDKVLVLDYADGNQVIVDVASEDEAKALYIEQKALHGANLRRAFTADRKTV